MKLATGPRPGPIRWFAILFTCAALGSFLYDLQRLHAVQDFLATAWPALATRDGAIIVTSARLTIGLIPVALIWLFASRVARWIIPVLALGKAVAALWPVNTLDALTTLPAIPVVTIAASITGAALLFTPRAAQWIANKGERNGAVLE